MADNELRDPSVYRAWLLANDDKKGTDRYKTVEEAYNTAARIAGAKQEWASGTPVERVGVMAASAGPMALDFLKSAGIRGGLATAGQIVGQRVAGKLGGAIGGGLGAGTGSVVDQMRKGEGVKASEVAVDAMSGAVNPRGFGTNAVLGSGMDIVRQMAEGNGLDLRHAAQAGLIGGVAGAAANKISGNSITPHDELMIERYKRFEAVRPYGARINPVEIERGSSFLNEIAGTDQLSVAAAKDNQYVWQKMARMQMGLPTEGNGLAFAPSMRQNGKGLVKGTLDSKIEEVSAPYQRIKEISIDARKEAEAIASGKIQPDQAKYLNGKISTEGVEAIINADKNLQELRQVRYDQKAALQSQMSGNPEGRPMWESLKKTEAELESKLELAAVASGEKNLVANMKDARDKIAVLKAYDNATTTFGHVDPAALSKQREAGVPLNGNAEKIALFYDAFKPSATSAVSAGNIRAGGVGAAYTLGKAAQGNVASLIYGGFPVISRKLREAIMSDPAQNAFVQPSRQLNAEVPMATMVRQYGKFSGQQAPTAEMLRAIGADRPQQ